MSQQNRSYARVRLVLHAEYDVRTPIDPDAYPGCTTAVEAARYDVRSVEAGGDLDLLLESADVNIVDVVEVPRA